MLAFGGEFKRDTGHTEWVEGRTHQTGFTTTFPPNTKVPFEDEGVLYDIDFTSSREGRSANLPTYAAVTQPVHNRAVGRWRHYADYLEPVLPALEPFIKAFGYER